MTRFRSVLILQLMVLAASGYMAAQEREVISQQHPGKNPHLGNKESIRGGMSLYRRLCADCHALDATGYRGPDLTAYMVGGTDEALFQTVRKGVPGSEMPASNRPDNELLQIIAYLRSMGGAPPAETIAGRQRCQRRTAVCEAVRELSSSERTGRPRWARIEPHRRRAHPRRAGQGNSDAA